MKILVSSARKDDLIKQRDQWESDNAAQKSKYEAQSKQFYEKQQEVFDDIKNQVLGYLSECKIDIVVNIMQALSFQGGGIEVRVESNERNVHGKDKALSWNWRVSLDSGGEVVKETSSWSGLQATTPAQLDSLRETVKALEILNDIDWSHMLNVTLPDYREYVTEPSSIGQRPKFESDILDEELKALIGTNTLVKGMYKPDGDRHSRGMNKNYYQYYLILKDSGSQYTIADVSRDQVENEEYRRGKTLAELVESAKKYSNRIRKDTFQQMLFKPLETVDVGGVE